jgi:hypothetical protein
LHVKVRNTGDRAAAFKNPNALEIAELYSPESKKAEDGQSSRILAN